VPQEPHLASLARARWESPESSGIAADWQELILGGLIKGIKVENGAFDWAAPFAALCGLGLVAGYGLLGAII
jgi:cytochrome bd ubiquinol oxidase subunit II